MAGIASMAAEMDEGTSSNEMNASARPSMSPRRRNRESGRSGDLTKSIGSRLSDASGHQC